MKYFVYIWTETKGECPYVDSLDEAVRLYEQAKMNTYRDTVCLGISSDVVGINSGYCFDVLHKFFDDNILIRDYLNHSDIPEIVVAVKEILSRFFVKYQYTNDLLGGALIDYQSMFARNFDGHEYKEINEMYLSTLKDNKLVTVGWVEPTRENYEKYSWAWPNTASYVGIINVKVIDKRGYPHNVDVDPRDYLLALGKRVSVPERSDDNENA